MGRERARNALLLALTFASCDRAPAKEAATTVEPTQTGPTKVVVPTEAAPILPSTRPEPAPVTTGSIKGAAPAKLATGNVLVSEKLFQIVMSPLAPCAPTTLCEAQLIVTALGGYKFNPEYPTKFVADASTSVTVDGTGAVTILARASARIAVKFRAAATGMATITGVLKISVCTDEVCEIAAPAVGFDVQVR